MLRDSWEFNYQVSDLIKATEARIQLHTKKFKWWENKKAEVMNKIRADGIQIHDSLAASYSNTKGAFGPQIEIESGLQRDLHECHIKILEHNQAIKSYEGWLQVFNANQNLSLKLNHDDWLYFFGEIIKE